MRFLSIHEKLIIKVNEEGILIGLRSENEFEVDSILQKGWETDPWNNFWREKSEHQNHATEEFLHVLVTPLVCPVRESSDFLERSIQRTLEKLALSPM